MRKSTVDSAMQRLKKKMLDADKENMYWSIKLLKSKGISDSEDKSIAGHVSEQMKELYDTKINRVRAAK